MDNYIQIGQRKVGAGEPVYIIAEMSANHQQDFNTAVKIIEAAKLAGADAIKLQTYTPDTITLDSDKEYFRIKNGSIWEGRRLYDLYKEAYTPWEWQAELKEITNNLEMELFSTPFDASAVDFLEDIGVPCYKIASFELVDIPLIKKAASTGKPMIMSTGMATLSEIEEAVTAVREAGCQQLALLKCTSAYPAPAEEINLKTIPHLAEAFKVIVGLSDHTLGIAVPVAAVALGAKIIEKHFTSSRSVPGPDSVFSLEPGEFKAMVDAVRTAEKALGRVNYQVTEKEAASRIFRRSLFVVKDMKAGEVFTEENVRSIRPGHGLHTRYLPEIIGRTAVKTINKGEPFKWDLIGG